jgi:glycosyltransferase involved in cell wall biosynthesis
MRVAVCSPQVPFAHGGAEILAEQLTAELRVRGHEADLVTVPFKWYPGEQVLTHSLLWRLIDLEEVDGRPVDAVIATKFPSYVVRHRNKIVWLVHQFRQAYELDRTELGQYGESPEERAIRRSVHDIDRNVLGEARRLCAISQNVADRLREALGLEAEVVQPPPQDLDYRCDGYENFVLSVGRLDRAKRIDLLLEAAGADPELHVVVAGDGSDRQRLEDVARRHGSNGRVRFAGRVSTEELTDLYARCAAVFYAPVDEDYGLVPFEAFRSEKPVVTTTDAGGPLEVVHDRSTGLVCEPRAAEIAAACRWLREHPDDLRAFGRAGKAVAEQVTWDHAIERLLRET